MPIALVTEVLIRRRNARSRQNLPPYVVVAVTCLRSSPYLACSVQPSVSQSPISKSFDPSLIHSSLAQPFLNFGNSSLSLDRTAYTDDMDSVKAESQSSLVLIALEMIGLSRQWLAPMRPTFGISSLVFIYKCSRT